MKAKELSLGDKVYLDYGGIQEVAIVTGLFEDGDIQVLGQSAYVDETQADIKPIPLTEMILKANGFVCRSSVECGCYYFPEKYKELNDRGFSVETDDEGKFWITDHQLMMARYVHELQRILRCCGLWDLANNFKV